MNVGPEKYVNICPDSQAALKALQAAKTTSPLVQKCQKVLNGICNWRHTVGLYWVPGHAGVQGNKIADRLATDGSVKKIVGLEPSLGVSMQNIKKKLECWVDNQHLAMWRGPSSIQRQAQKLSSGPSSTTKTRLLYLNRTQSSDVTGLLIRHNTLGRHLHLMRMINSALCRRCSTKEETSVHILCE